MTAAAVLLLAGGLALGLVPGLAGHALEAAAVLQDREAYAATVLRGADGAGVGRGPDAGVGLADWLLALVSVAGATGLAAVGLRRGRLAGLPGGRLGTWGRAALGGLRALHSGHVGDSVTWLVVGTAALGGLWALTLT